MSIDEAIEFSRYKASQQYNELDDYEYDAKEHKQLAEWLEELKLYQQLDLEIPQHFTKEQSAWIKKYCINRNKEFYNKAIDDFENKILNNCTSKYIDGERVIVVRNDIFKFILEQLKGGD